MDKLADISKTTAVKAKPASSKGDRIFDIVNITLLSIVVLVCLIPFIHILAISLSSARPIMSGEVSLFPVEWTVEAYVKVFSDMSMIRSLGFTVMLTVIFTILCMAMTIAAGYPLSKSNLKGRGFFMVLIIITMFFSGGLIPTYLIVKQLGLVNSMWALILPGAASVWNIIVARTFFQSTIPIELQEAAHMDGCTNLRLFLKIVVPLSTPIIAVMALFYGVGHWNSYFNALVYLNDQSKYPLQMVLRQILVLQEMSTSAQGAATSGEAAMAMNAKADMAALLKYAVIIVATLPIIAVYPFVQRYFVQGVMIGSVKG